MRTWAMAAVVLASLSGAVYRIGFWRAPSTDVFPGVMIERVTLTASDGIALVGDYYAPASPAAKGLLLLHMMPATRSSWRAFAERAQGAGWHVLAIDLRGHGESQGGPDGYRSFSDAEHQASRFDVEAGATFLASKGVDTLALGGASIGANLALQYLSDPPAGGPDARAAFLLSPGLDYRGVKTEPFARRVRPDQAAYFAASAEDMRSSGQSATDMAGILHGLCPCRKEIKMFENAGHGTTMFEREPGFMAEILAWLQKVAP